MTLAALEWHGHGLLAALAGFLLGFLAYWFFGRRGKTHEEVLRRVVETSTDESTRLKTLTDEHAHALKLKDDALLKLKSDNDGELASLRTQLDKSLALVKTHEADLTTHKAESVRLQGLVGTVDASKQEIEGLKAQLTKQKNDYELTLGDWRKRAESGEAAKVAADKQLADINAEHARVVGEWQAKVQGAEAKVQAAEAKVQASEAKAVEVQGLLGSTKADNDKALAEWRARAEKAEGDLGNWSRRYAELESSQKNADAEHARVVSEWQSKAKASEAEHARVVGEWQAKVQAAEVKVQASEAKAVEVQGLLGSTKADNDKALAEWRARAEKAEGDLGNWSRRYAELESSQKNADAEHARVAADWRKRAETAEASLAGNAQRTTEWEAKFNASEAERAKLAADLDARAKAAADAAAAADARVKGLEAERAKFAADLDARAKAAADAAAAADARVHALEADRAKVNTDWQTRFAALEAQHAEVRTHVAARDTEIQGLRGQLAEASAGPDDLTVIEGIGPKINLALRADGITRWVHVRDASQDRLRSAIEKGGITFAPSLTTWSKQASYLVAGDQAGFKQYTEYLISGQDPANYGGEVVTGVERAQALASGAVYGSGTVEVDESAKNKDGSDNLLIIEGIGPKFNEALLRAGISTFAKLASSSEDQLKAAIQAAGLSFAPSLSTWAQQSALVASGDMAGFKALTDRLVAGRHDG